jgi:dethiobiotin synthetase
MSWRSLRRWFQQSGREVRKSGRLPGWPILERLEDRLCPSTAPAITTQPTDVTANAGVAVTFHAAASGTPAPTVQWDVSTNGGTTFKPIAGAIHDTLSFTARGAEDGDQYEAIFTNSAGRATTNAATLTVHFAPAVTTQPDSQTVAIGGSVTLHAAANGDPAPTVQWETSTDGGRTFQAITGATSDTLSFTAPSQPGAARYRAVFTNTLGTATTRAVTVTTDVPPAVTTQPSDVTTDAGKTVTFHAAASGTPAPTVQWEVSTDGGTTFKPIAGATHDTLSFTARPAEDGDQYEAVFTNPVGKATTTAATLTVHFAPVVAAQPSDVTVAVGGSVTLHATANGDPAPTVQWETSTDGGRTFQAITGATSDTLTFTAPSQPGTARYRAVFTNTLGTATTRAVTVTTDVPPAVTTQPSDVTADAGRTVTFHAAASGTPAPTVQWEVSTDGGTTFKPIAGATHDTLSFTARAAEDGDQYEAIFTNPVGRATTNPATLTVHFAPEVTAQPSGVTVAVGGSVTLHAAASGDPAPTVQWETSTDGGRTFQAIAGATSDTLTFTAPSQPGTARYRAVFTNTLGTATTRTVTVTTDVPPAVTTQPSDATANVGRTVTFHAAASGTPAPTVQWEVSTDGGTTFKPIAGATHDTLSFTARASENGDKYEAVFTNPVGKVTTDPATLTVMNG